MTDLLDANVLIALALDDHVHHVAAVSWWQTSDAPFATCPITQGALLRTSVRQGGGVHDASQLLAGLSGAARHRFWPDDIPYHEVALGHVLGHRQVTDAYLAGLARHHGGRLATFDRGLAAQAPDVVTLVPVG